MLRELKRTKIEFNKLDKALIYRIENNRMENTYELHCLNCNHIEIYNEFHDKYTCPQCQESTIQIYNRYHCSDYINCANNVIEQSLLKSAEYDADFFECIIESKQYTYNFTANSETYTRTLENIEYIIRFCRQPNGKMKGFIFKNNEPVKFLKANLVNIFRKVINRKEVYKLRLFNQYRYGIYDDVFWEIFNAYKNNREYILYEIVHLAHSKGYLDEILENLKSSEFYRNAFYKIIDESKNLNEAISYVDIQRKIPSINPEFYKIKEHLLTIEEYSNMNDNELNQFVEIFLEFDYTPEERIAFLQSANRQAYILHDYKLSNIYNVYKTLVELNIPIEKVPREMHIYYTKGEIIRALTIDNYNFTNLEINIPSINKPLKIDCLSCKEIIEKMVENNQFNAINNLLYICKKDGTQNSVIGIKDTDILLVGKMHGSYSYNTCSFVVNNVYKNFKLIEDENKIIDILNEKGIN